MARTFLQATSINNTLALFAGGADSLGNDNNTVDIYNVTSGLWSTATLSQGRIDFAATSVGRHKWRVGYSHTLTGTCRLCGNVCGIVCVVFRGCECGFNVKQCGHIRCTHKEMECRDTCTGYARSFITMCGCMCMSCVSACVCLYVCVSCVDVQLCCIVEHHELLLYTSVCVCVCLPCVSIECVHCV